MTHKKKNSKRRLIFTVVTIDLLALAFSPRFSLLSPYNFIPILLTLWLVLHLYYRHLIKSYEGELLSSWYYDNYRTTFGKWFHKNLVSRSPVIGKFVTGLRREYYQGQLNSYYVVTVLVAVVILILDLTYKPSLYDLLIQIHGLLFNLVVFGIIILYLEKFVRRKDTINSNLAIISGLRNQDSDIVSGKLIDSLRNVKSIGIFQQIDLSECFFRNLTLKHINFSQSDFTEATIKNCKLFKSDFSNSKFCQTSLKSTVFEECDFSFCSFESILLEDATFNNCKFDHAVISEEVLDIIREQETHFSIEVYNEYEIVESDLGEENKYSLEKRISKDEA